MHRDGKFICDGYIFIRLFETAQTACFDSAERYAYEDSLKYHRDLKNVTDTAHEEGVEEGLAKGLQQGRQQGLLEAKQAIASKLKAEGLCTAQIAKITGLSLNDLSKH